MGRAMKIRFALAGAIGLFSVVPVFAQMDGLTFAAPGETEQKLVEVVLKLVLPFLWTIVSPWLSGVLLSGFAIVPVNIQRTLTTLIGAGFGAAVGFIPDFPLGVESAAEFGGSTSLASQITGEKNPSTFTPKIIKEVPIVKSIILGICLLGMVGCAGSFGDQIRTTLQTQVAGTYKVELTKDGRVVATETWVCTNENEKLQCKRTSASAIPPVSPAQ